MCKSSVFKFYSDRGWGLHPSPSTDTGSTLVHGYADGELLMDIGLKEQSRPSISNVKSADVSLTTTLGRERHWSTS